MIDPWTHGTDRLDDELPFAGRAAVLAGLLSVTAGVLGTAGLVAVGAWLRNRRWVPRP